MEKQYDVRITPFAENSMREIGRYLAVDLLAPEAASRLIRTFYAEIQKLRAFPCRVHRTPEEPWHSLGVRRLLVKNYYLYFLVDDSNAVVQVIDVTYAKRDQRSQLTTAFPTESDSFK